MKLTSRKDELMSMADLIGCEVRATMLVDTNIFDGHYVSNFIVTGVIKESRCYVLKKIDNEKEYVVPARYLALEILKKSENNVAYNETFFAVLESGSDRPLTSEIFIR